MDLIVTSTLAYYTLSTILIVNVRQGYLWPIMTNTLAYTDASLMETIKFWSLGP